MNDKTFYVYVLVRPDGKPFYVGKGRGNRIYEHEKHARQGRRDHKSNIIRKIWKQGGEVQRYVVFSTDDEQEAYAYEIEMIALFGVVVKAVLLVVRFVQARVSRELHAGGGDGRAAV